MLYKYYSFSSHVIDSIANSNVYFSRPKQFNDPFDCYPIVAPIDFDRFKVFHQSSVSTIKDCYSDVHKFLNSDTAIEIFYRPISSSEALLNHYRENMDNYGIFCLSRSYDHPLMWGHYADGHRGFCVGYEVNHNERAVWSISDSFERSFSTVRDINYSESPTDLIEIYSILLALSLKNPSLRDENGWLTFDKALSVFENKSFMSDLYYAFFISIFSHKHKSWSYENETRVIKFRQAQTAHTA